MRQTDYSGYINLTTNHMTNQLLIVLMSALVIGLGVTPATREFN